MVSRHLRAARCRCRLTPIRVGLLRPQPLRTKHEAPALAVIRGAQRTGVCPGALRRVQPGSPRVSGTSKHCEYSHSPGPRAGRRTEVCSTMLIFLRTLDAATDRRRGSEESRDLSARL